MDKNTTNKRVNLFINTKESDGTIKGTRKEVTKLWNELQRAEKGSEDFVRKSREFQQADKRLKNLKNEALDLNNSFLSLNKSLKTFGIFAAANLATDLIKEGLSSFINQNAQLSDELSDIQKKTGMTLEEVKELDEAFKEIDTRTSRKELREIATVAGQLGIAKEDVFAFTEAVDKAVVSLGDDFGGGADVVATKLGKLQNLFKETKRLKPDEAINQIGSAINDLAASGSASAPVVADFTQRLGALGDLAPRIDETLGYAAAFEELGLTAEIAAGGLSNILLKAGEQSEKFAIQMGLSTDEFKELLNTDPNQMLIQLAESMKGLSNVQVAETMKELKIGTQESIKVISLLSKQTDLLKTKQEIANQAMEKATSLTDEFNIKNNNLAGNLEKIQKRLLGAFVNSQIMEGIENMVSWVAKYIEIPLSEKLEDEQLKLIETKNRLYDVNLQQEDRVKLINELIKEYPDYFAGIDAETATNKELARTIKAINDQLINKIILQKEDEKISEQNEIVAEKRLQLIKAEAALRKQNAEVESKYQSYFESGRFSYQDDLTEMENYQEFLIFLQKERQEAIRNRRSYDEVALSDVRDLNSAIADVQEAKRDLFEVENQTNLLLKSRQELMEQLSKQTQDDEVQSKADLEYWKKVADERLNPKEEDPDGSRTSPFDIDEKKGEAELEKLKKQQQKVLEEYQKFEEALEREKELRHYKGLEEAQKRAEEQDELRDEIYQMGLNDREREIYEIQQHYDHLIEMAKELRLEEEEIETLKQMKLNAIHNAGLKDREMNTQESMQAMNSLFNAFSQLQAGLLQAAANNDQEYLEFQKGLTIAQIAIDTGSAIAAVTAKNAQSSLTPIDYAIKVAAAITTVLANMVKAKNLMDSEEIPSAPSFFYGGDTGSKALYRDQYGPVTGAVHANEYVIPEYLRKDPEVADFERIIEAKRTNTDLRYQKRKQISMEGQTAKNDDLAGAIIALDAKFNATMEKIDTWRSSLTAKIIYKEVREFEDDIDYVEQNSKL
ncbi:phage tail tape measure protein [Chondrinema litorale]|uniref:phage tail tape measure protein n=1 Tax=Chondrinema litorale TaxID=2994555 RepID=UPI00254363F5|nr:phage tail tape measure protein [Chondrinema litorale]UZR95926.1 phage tail tape measure protein [Chondrinema litorale]